jgi:hypothetical protein
MAFVAEGFKIADSIIAPTATHASMHFMMTLEIRPAGAIHALVAVALHRQLPIAVIHPIDNFFLGLARGCGKHLQGCFPFYYQEIAGLVSVDLAAVDALNGVRKWGECQPGLPFQRVGENCTEWIERHLLQDAAIIIVLCCFYEKQ